MDIYALGEYEPVVEQPVADYVDDHFKCESWWVGVLVYGILVDDGMPGAEGRGAINVVELCNGDPDGLGPCPGGELHVCAEGHVAGNAVTVK